MIKDLQPWVRMPNGWIEAGGLKRFTWMRGQGANNVAALMILIVIAHHAEHPNGIAHLTYDELSDITGLSRAKLSAGIKILVNDELIIAKYNGRSGYLLANYEEKNPWAKLPANALYRHGSITVFADFTLRQPAELEALKLYLLFASRRDRKTNMAYITYDQIEERSGVNRGNIRRALSFLAANTLVHIDYINSLKHDGRDARAYRLTHLEPRQHLGTVDRTKLVDDIVSATTNNS